MTIDEFLERLEGVKPGGGGYVALCPGHEDTDPSLGVREGENGTILISCYTGCRNEDIVKAMGLTLGDLFPGRAVGMRVEPEAVYQYTDESGTVLFEACRFPEKKFKQRHVDPDTGETVYTLEGVRRVLYQLPIVLQGIANNQTIWLCEGEKDVHSLLSRGVIATCNPMGAGKWRPEYTESLAGASVIIVQDKDEAGRHHSERVREKLREVAIFATIVEARDGKDATDHFEAGWEITDFIPVIERARRGIVTAREMAENGQIHLKAEPETIPEYVIPEFQITKRQALTFRKGRPYLLGGYTSDGKTTAALQWTRSLCSFLVPPRVGFFSMEMSADDLRNRLIEHWGVPLYVIEHPWLMTDHQKMLYHAAIEQLREWPLEIIFDTQLSATAICDTTRDRDYDFVIVDHIHRFSWGGERRILEREVAMLTNLALDFNIPVLVLAQLRSRQQGQGKFVQFPRPTINEFKETSVLGEEAAMALAIWRYRAQDTTYDPTGNAELITLKNRYGPTGSFNCQLDTQRMIFTPTGGVPNDPGQSAAQDQPSTRSY